MGITIHDPANLVEDHVEALHFDLGHILFGVPETYLEQSLGYLGMILERPVV